MGCSPLPYPRENEIHFGSVRNESLMARTYNHLSDAERAAIMIERQTGSSAKKIAQKLGRSPTTISREILRAGGGYYDATIAAEKYKKRRLKSRRKKILREGTELYQYVKDQLVNQQWSPEQISETLKNMPDDTRPGTVSHETIYATIYAKPLGNLKKELIEALRQAKKYRGTRRVTPAGARFVPSDKKIELRPKNVESREFVGHWEGDFIKGAHNRSAVGVLVERKTRYVVLCKMAGCTAEDALEGFSRQMKKLPKFIRQSITYDQGSEMACHEELSKRLKLDIWFCDPHAPWQRASNENTNGLLRQYLPKGENLSVVSQTTLNNIAMQMNTRPRKIHGFKTPLQMMDTEIDAFMNAQQRIRRENRSDRQPSQASTPPP